MSKACALLFALLALVGSGYCERVWFASPTGGAGNCTQAFPCSIWTTCANAEPFDTIQLLDGQYNLGNLPCVTSSAHVSVVGGAAVSVSCTDSCFVLEAVPFSISEVDISSTGSADATAAIYGTVVDFDVSLTTITVSIDQVTAVLNDNNLLYLDLNQTALGVGKELEISLSSVDVSGSSRADAVSGCVSAWASPSALSWTFFSVNIFDFTSVGGSPVLDISAFQSVTSLRAQNLYVENSTVYALFDSSNGGSAEINYTGITSVQNYVDGTRTSQLLNFANWDSISFIDVTFENITNDVSGLIYVGADQLSLSGLTMTDCEGVPGPYMMWASSVSDDGALLTISDWEMTNVEYDMVGYFLYDYYNNCTATIVSSSFTDVVSRNHQLLNLVRPTVVLSDITVIGGTYPWGVLSLSDPNSVSATNLIFENVTSEYALISSQSEVVKEADFVFESVEVTDSVISTSVFIFAPDNSTWTVEITSSAFETDSSNTTAIVSCYGDGSGGAMVLVESVTCSLGDECAAIDDGYVSNGVCEFSVEDDSLCSGECSSSGGDGGTENDFLEVLLWIGIAIAALVVLVVAIGIVVAIVVVIVVAVRKKRGGYDQI